MSRDILSAEDRSLLQLIVANPGSAEAAAAVAELEIRSRKVSEAINRRMLTLTIVLAMAAIGQVSTALIPLFKSGNGNISCACARDGGDGSRVPKTKNGGDGSHGSSAGLRGAPKK